MRESVHKLGYGHKQAATTASVLAGGFEARDRSSYVGAGLVSVGGGAALGTLIGAIAGGGKGAAIGAAIGAGTGLGTEVLTKGKQVRVPAETLLNFKIDQDVRLQALR